VRSFLRNSAASLLVLLIVSLAAVSGDAAGRHARGVVTDESKGVLPGATVVVTDTNGRIVATAVTDAAGRYDSGPLAPGEVTLTFQLPGFAEVAIRAEIGTDVDAVVSPCLKLAPQAETVEVVGKVPLPLPPPPPIAPPTPKPRPLTLPVPEHDRDAVCAPAKLTGAPESFGLVRARRYAANELYAKGDELVIDSGALDGIKVGQNFVVRRSFPVAWAVREATGEHTAGLVQIVAADEHSSVAVVIYACDEMIPGDRLASFTPQPPRAPSPAGTPDYRRAARIIFSDIGQSLGAPRRMMVIDHGSAFGVRAGQRVTLFRRRDSDGDRPFVIGEAVVIAVRFDSATIRVERVSDAILPGDWAAIQR
jgi:Carboxypeptidase regulatory-like domain